MITVRVTLPDDLYWVNIWRIRGERRADARNWYRAEVERSAADPQPMTSVEFEHLYGDGWEMCVARALEALRNARE